MPQSHRSNTVTHTSRLRRTRSAASLLLVAAVGVVAYSEVSSTQDAPVPAPSVTTDGTAYVAGKPVTIAGRDFTAGESVTVQVTHADGTAEPGMGHGPSIATVAPDGTFQATWTPSATDVEGPQFSVTASGNLSGTVAPAAFTRVAVVTTDKGDYQPNEFVHIDGHGFAPGELVELQVVHANGQDDGNGHEPFYVTADEDGDVTATLTGHYSYVWKTDKAWAGTCRQLVVRFSDGTTHRASFKFTK